MKILVLNNGSSNCKLSLYDLELADLSHPMPAIWSTIYTWENSQSPVDRIKKMSEKLASMPIPLSQIDVVGHRIVHGGNQFQHPLLISEVVKQGIKQLSYLAPLHIPKNLEGIEMIERLMPSTPQIGVFDTSFHSTLSEAAQTYAGPYSWKALGIKKYGFHGISYEYCSARCSTLLHKEKLKIVCCHLGNGASMAAIDNHRSVDTTMGFTPLEGLMMGSRCGSIDPGIILFLEQQHQQTPEELTQALYHASGLQGISGESNDMRDIVRLCSEDHLRARLSFDMYIHSLKRNIGAMVGVLDGFDALIFSGGIGENSALVREKACRGLQHFGVILDEEKNGHCQKDAIISSSDSPVKVVVIATQEDWCIACTIKKMRSNGTV